MKKIDRVDDIYVHDVGVAARHGNIDALVEFAQRGGQTEQEALGALAAMKDGRIHFHSPGEAGRRLTELNHKGHH